MTIVGDSKAYVFLSKHGPLVQELPHGIVLLTLAGRIFILTFLFFHEYLTKDAFNEISLTESPDHVGYQTGKMLRSLCQKWLDNNHRRLNDLTIAYPTDLSFASVSFLMQLLIAGQENLEVAVEGKKVQ